MKSFNALTPRQHLLKGGAEMPTSLKVFIADDQPKVRLALRVSLECQSDMVVIGEAVDAIDMLTQLKSLHPNVLLMDWELPGLAGSTLYALRVILPEAAIIALSSHPENQRLALGFGANGFVNKSAPPETLLQTMNALTHWNMQASPAS
jgi:DNA-binding NarL/FixJ family response regulator